MTAAWGQAAVGRVVLNAPTEGTAIWTPQGIGGHTLTHTAGGLAYTAQFAVLGDEVTIAGGRLSSSAFWATNKTHLITAPLTIPSTWRSRSSRAR